MASKHLTSDQQNFTRLVIVCVDLIKLVLKDILRSKIKPTDLHNAISLCAELTSGHKKLRPEQRRLCYLPAPNVPDYSAFDVTLLYTLIRNLCPSLKPTLGWGNTPSQTAIQIGDDIERLRIFRNEVHGHCESSNVTDTEFRSRWMDIETAIRRVEALLSSQGLLVNYEKELKKIKNLDLGSEDMDKYKLLLEGMMCLLKNSENEGIPKILIHGENKVTCGEVACFQVDVESSSMTTPWSVTWQRVRGDITEQINISTEKYRGSNDRQLVIQRISKADEGEYQAVLSQQNIKLTSNSIFLVAEGDQPVLQALEVSTGLDGITLHYQYTVTSKSPNVHHIAWMKNGKILGIDLLKYVGGGIDDGRLTITSPTVEDAGQYTCTVSNDVAAVSQSRTLDIPSVTVSAEVPVYVGSETKIDSVVAACPPPEGATWQRSSDSVTFENINMDNPRHYGSTNDPSSPVLTITKAAFDDKLFYRLLVWNKIGQCVSNTVYLNVTGGPPNISNSQETNIQNRTVTLPCEIFLYKSSPTLQEVCWMKNNDVLDIGGSGGKLAGGTITNPSLVINNVNEFDAGSYQCKASNAVGSTLGNVIVLGIPDIDIRENTTNDTQVFTAVLMSIPAPMQVQWNVKNELTGDWTPVDANTDEYKGTTDSLPQPVLIVKRKERIKNHSFKITVKNFIGIKSKLIPDERARSGNDKENPKESTSLRYAMWPMGLLLKMGTHYNRYLVVDAISAIIAKKGSTIRFNNLLLHIINEVPDKELSTLKRSLTVMTSKTSLDNVTSIGEFIDFLLVEGLIKERNVIMMQYLLRSIQRSDLEIKCTEYATENKQALCYHEEIKISGDQRKQIKIHVVNDIENFYEMDSLRATVAAIVGCELSSIEVVGIHPESSFVIVMLVKAEFARLLLQKDQEELAGLLKFNVDWIQIEDKVIKIQRSKSEEIEGKAHQDEKKIQKGYGKQREPVKYSTKMKTMGKHQSKYKKVEDVSLSHEAGLSATQISSITVPGVDHVNHICVVTSDRLWVSDLHGRLLQVDSTGHVLHDELRDRIVPWFTGSHTVTEDGDLLFIDNYTKVCKLTSDGTVTTLLTTDRRAHCIHSSRINGDILVGSYWGVTRYDRTGRELQVIERDDKGQRLYRIPMYITENRNGDIWTSDRDKTAVVVVDKSGRHRFNYTGRQSGYTGRQSGYTGRPSGYTGRPPGYYKVHQSKYDRQSDDTDDESDYTGRQSDYYTGRQSDYTGRQSRFYPHAICTDVRGHVLVCDEYSDSVHLLDQDGQFLSLLLTRKQHGIHSPMALCVDDQHNLYVGQAFSNTINVYKYLQDTDVK